MVIPCYLLEDWISVNITDIFAKVNIFLIIKAKSDLKLNAVK